MVCVPEREEGVYWRCVMRGEGLQVFFLGGGLQIFFFINFLLRQKYKRHDQTKQRYHTTTTTTTVPTNWE